MDKQYKRYLAAFVLGMVGFIIILGAVGGLEYGDFTYGQAIARGIVGLLIMAAGIPVSGDLPEIREQIAERRKEVIMHEHYK